MREKRKRERGEENRTRRIKRPPAPDRYCTMTVVVHEGILCTVVLHVCIYIWSSYITREGPIGEGYQFCSWSVEQGKLIFPCPRSRLRMRCRKTGSAIPSRVSLLISILGLNLVLTYGISPVFRAASIQPYAIGSAPS